MSGLFAKRSVQPELMDTEAVDFQTFDECLSHLEHINAWTGAYPPTLNWLRDMWNAHSQPTASHPKSHLTVWDVGSGGGDMLRRIWQHKPPHISLQLTGIDMNPWSRQSAVARTGPNPGIQFITANIFDLPPSDRPDYIISSLFTHHLSDEELVRFITWMENTCQKGWFINDLHRHPLPYYFIGWIVRVLRLNRLVQHDAPVSVLRAFTRSDWRNLISAAGLSPDAVDIKWYWPFRYGVGRCKI